MNSRNVWDENYNYLDEQIQAGSSEKNLFRKKLTACSKNIRSKQQYLQILRNEGGERGEVYTLL